MNKFIVFLVVLLHIFLVHPIRVPCRSNRVAPLRSWRRPRQVDGSRQNERTLGLLLSALRPFGDPPSQGDDCPPAGNPGFGDEQQAVDVVDPVYSGEDIDYSPNRPSNNSPNRPQTNTGGLFSNWWQNLPNWQLPWQSDRPQNDWFWGWFNRPSNSVNKPTSPPYYENDKPVHEHIEDEQEQTSWKPGALVGGPSNSIVGVTQDLSSWTRPPTPRPTRPQIPGYPEQQQTNRRPEQNQGIIGSFVDLLFRD